MMNLLRVNSIKNLKLKKAVCVKKNKEKNRKKMRKYIKNKVRMNCKLKLVNLNRKYLS